MRSKIAKSLRNEARNKSVGKPWTAYVNVTDQRGRLIRKELHPECGRAIYEKLKKEVA